MDIREFLKKFSTLNNDFIDDFYNIYDPDSKTYNDFSIDIEIVSKWLNSKKGKLKETLINTYNKNIDYKITKKKEDKISKSNKEIIMLTPDCFKRLCLLSKTIKAEEVRTYFLELEKLISNYKNYIIEGLKNTIMILENNTKEISQKVKGTVYILRSLKDINGIYRFGQTEEFKKRIANYNSANSDKMKVILIYETKNAKKIETCVLSQIKELRYKKRKDFYEMDLKLLKQITTDCIDLTLKYKKSVYNNIKKYNNQDGGDNIDNMYLYIHK